MYAALSASIIGWLIGALIPVAFAREVLTVSPNPADYDAVQTELDKIPPYLESLQCGGYGDRSVNNTIASVSGLPGRNADWDKAIHTGVAARRDENQNTNRDDDFIYPDTANGLSTSCNPDQTDIQKSVWQEKPNGRPGEIETADVTYPHPKFLDPSCRWRPKEGNTFRSQAPDIPLKPIGEYGSLDYGELDTEPEDRQSPPVCMGFCEMLNSYQFYDCLETDTVPDPVDPDQSYTICKRWGNRYLCSDQEVTDPVGACNSNSGDKANSIQCVGQECRCQGDTGPAQNGCVANPGTKERESAVYYSYYRIYGGSYSRDQVDKDEGDDKEADSGPVACYGFYNEFDPKFHRTEDKDRRCVINLNVVDRFETQTGKAEYGQNRDEPDANNPDDNANQRDPDFNDEEDLWYQKFSGGFSLLNEKMFSSAYSKNLTNVFLDLEKLDSARMEATRQLYQKPFASGSTVRSYDDTGEREVSIWWQSQQSTVASLLHPPVVRLILPAGSAIGIDPDDPYFSQTVTLVRPLDKRDERIEVQINADEDMLGAAVSLVRRTGILDIREEKVPLIVPLGSPTEFRAKAEAWCTWVKRTNSTTDCNDPPTDVQELMDTLEKYADEIDKMRLLRTALPKYAAKLLALQRSVTDPLRIWLEENIESYRNYLRAQESVQRTIADEWRTAQEFYENFESKTNMPWCMNQRFTLPVYSMLDPWLPSRANNAKIAAHGLPIITAPSVADIVIDLSTIGSLSGGIIVPVLEPIQVRITDFPNPPNPGEPHDIPSEYPDLPSIDEVLRLMEDAAEALPDPPQNPPVIPPLDLPEIDISDFSDALSAMSRIKDVIGGEKNGQKFGGSDSMNERYDLFWKSMSPLRPDEPGQDDRNGIKQMKERLECYSWNDKTCQHVEMDLRERFQRIGSRPLIFMQEDYGSVDLHRGIGGPCIAQHDICTPVHPEEGGETHILEIRPPQSLVEFIDDLRRDIRDETLAEPIGERPADEYPRYGVTGSLLLPPFELGRPIELIQSSSSSSSSRS
jgi:hypothetical protein